MVRSPAVGRAGGPWQSSMPARLEGCDAGHAARPFYARSFYPAGGRHKARMAAMEVLVALSDVPPVTRYEAIVRSLGASTVLGRLSEAARRRVALAGSPVVREAGEVLCQAGDEGDALYVVIEGEIEVVSRSEGGRQVRLAALGAGALAGEMAALDGTYAVTSSGVSVVATAADVPPTISGAASASSISDAQTASPFSQLTISDPTVGSSETVTLTLTNTSGVATDADGVLSGQGLTKTATGVYTLAGSPAAVTAELEALVFTPTAHQVAAGSSVTTDFTVSVSDGGAAARDGTAVHPS
jgi:hypothetical protein